MIDQSKPIKKGVWKNRETGDRITTIHSNDKTVSFLKNDDMKKVHSLDHEEFRNTYRVTCPFERF